MKTKVIYAKSSISHKDIFIPGKKTTEISEEVYNDLKNNTILFKRGIITDVKLDKKPVKKEIEEEEINTNEK